MFTGSMGFNPRSHKGSDYASEGSGFSVTGFNPRSHEGSDSSRSSSSLSIYLVSIHAPTRGATPTILRFKCHLVVSIHAPTRGATFLLRKLFHNPAGFNPRSHEGSDSGDSITQSWVLVVSIHAPTRGATWSALF